MTPADLKTRTVRDLANLAKKQKVPGWHAMRKDELVKALLKHVRSNLANRENQRRNGNGNAKFASHQENPEVRLIKIKEKFSQIKDLSLQTDGNGQSKDRLVVMVRDPFWLHAYWELDRRSINRARVAMSQHWHASRPILAAIPGASRGDHRSGAENRTGHRNPRRREQLVHRRPRSAQDFSIGNRLPVGRRQVLLPCPQQRGHDSRGRQG